MTFEPLLSASLAIQIHACAAIMAIFLGALALGRKRRDRLHKTAGYIWIVLMAVVAISTVFITAEVGPTVAGFGVIHIFSVVVLVSLCVGLRAAVRRDIALHRKTMRALYIQSLGITGLFTLLPGRRMNEVLFSSAPLAGIVVIVLGGAVIAWLTISL